MIEKVIKNTNNCKNTDNYEEKQSSTDDILPSSDLENSKELLNIIDETENNAYSEDNDSIEKENKYINHLEALVKDYKRVASSKEIKKRKKEYKKHKEHKKQQEYNKKLKNVKQIINDIINEYSIKSSKINTNRDKEILNLLSKRDEIDKQLVSLIEIVEKNVIQMEEDIINISVQFK